MKNIKQTGKCCLCKYEYTHFGNNPQPLMEGRCCNSCDLTKVVPERIRIFKEKSNQQNKSEIEEKCVLLAKQAQTGSVDKQEGEQRITILNTLSGLPLVKYEFDTIEELQKAFEHLEDYHDCKECNGKIVGIRLDGLGNTYCGYCRKVVRYPRLSEKGFKKWVEEQNERF